MANKKKNKPAAEGSNPTHLKDRVDASVVEAGTVSGEEAAEAVDAALEASANIEEGADGPQTEEEPSHDIAEARKKDNADKSPATVQPTLDNANMLNDGDHGLTPGQRANLADDDPRKADPRKVAGANVSMNDGYTSQMPNATANDLASALDVDDDETKGMTPKAAAEGVGIPEGTVLDYAVRSGKHGKVLTVVDTQGKKHAANV